MEAFTYILVLISTVWWYWCSYRRFFEGKFGKCAQFGSEKKCVHRNLLTEICACTLHRWNRVKDEWMNHIRDKLIGRKCLYTDGCETFRVSIKNIVRIFYVIVVASVRSSWQGVYLIKSNAWKEKLMLISSLKKSSQRNDSVLFISFSFRALIKFIQRCRQNSFGITLT